MSSLFSKPKKPDTSAQTALIAQQDAQLKQQEATTRQQEATTREKDAAMAATRRARSSSRASLITGGNEQGVLRTTLG